MSNHPELPQKLPLYRPEAIAARQQNSFGQIILIHPLPLAFLGGIALVVVLAITYLLVFGSYTETLTFHGTLVTNETNAGPALLASTKARIIVPRSHFANVTRGENIRLYCSACDNHGQQRTAFVAEIHQGSTEFDSCAPSVEPQTAGDCSMIVSFSPPITLSVRPGLAPAEVPVDATLPGTKQPLVKWIFNKSRS